VHCLTLIAILSLLTFVALGRKIPRTNNDHRLSYRIVLKRQNRLKVGLTVLSDSDHVVCLSALNMLSDWFFLVLVTF